MKSLTLTPTFFGVDLRQLGQDWAQALALMAQWPGVRWLTPKYPTRLILPQGGQTTAAEVNGHTHLLANSPHTPFHGLILPDDMILWHSLQLPPLQGEALTSALQLEVERLNPFPPQELLWAHTPTQKSSAKQTLHIAITSRRLVDKHLATPLATPPAAGSANRTSTPPEIWAQHPKTGLTLVFSGYGETLRHRRTRNARTLNLLLLALLMLACMAAAVTPSLQLRYRVQQAFSDYSQLQQQAGKAVTAREQMTQLHDRVQQLQALAGQRMVPEYVLLLLTRYIPEDTYILVIDIKGNTINLTGITPNATALMQHLGKQPGVTKVTAPNPSRRERDREAFNIQFNLQAPPPEPTAAAPGGQP